MSSTACPESHAVRYGMADGQAVCVLSSWEHDVHVTFAPALGMVASSLRHRGDELLGRRQGLDAYARTGATMGIPLLHPWANRLGGAEYRFGGRHVTLSGGTPLDDNGLPIHGLLAAIRGWSPKAAGADARRARLVAELDAVLAGFPFPHTLTVEAELRGATLTITTTLRATGSVAVPVAFGYHPYLRLPDVPREEWAVEIPVTRRLELDARGIPTGGSRRVAPHRGPLGARTFDDAFVAPAEQPFVLAGGGRRIAVSFEEGYPYAQVFAPADDDVICFEPMTAPANALRGCHGPPPAVAPGEAYRARFSLTVEDAR